MLKLTAKTAKYVAQNANTKKQKEALENILNHIKEQAESGKLSTSYYFISEKNIKELKTLGYKVWHNGLEYAINWE